jgi:aquaporin Z
MIAAGIAGTLLEYPASPLHQLISSAIARRFLMGLAMGGTAILLIYSRWGARSGAHFNPAITLTFALLGKIAPRDAIYYVAAQFIGGVAGVLLVHALCGAAFALPPVQYNVTVPGNGGVALAFWMEALISFLLMLTVLWVSNQPRWMHYTGACCGVLIALFVTIEAPFSGMSMNPARTLASALPSGIWHDSWIYFVAPLAGMLLAAGLIRWIKGREHIQCAKINHNSGTACPFRCGFRERGVHVPTLIHSRSSHS